MTTRLSGMIAPVALALGLAALATAVGLRTDARVLDVDQAVYLQTLNAMHEGESYYAAMRAAIIQKQGVPPRSVRAVRPPTMFLALAPLPPRARRWVVAIAYFAVALAAWHLARPYGTRAAVAGSVLAALWVIGAARFTFLHAELWGLPFFLWGILETRRGRGGRAAALIAVAGAIRELYVLALPVGFLALRRRTWVIATAALTAFLATHAALATRILSPAGSDVALGNQAITWRLVLTALSPGDRPAGWVVGATSLALGIAALIRYRRRDRAAAMLLPILLVIAPLSVLATRTYWSLVWGPAIAAFAPTALAGSRATGDSGGPDLVARTRT